MTGDAPAPSPSSTPNSTADTQQRSATPADDLKYAKSTIEHLLGDIDTKVSSTQSHNSDEIHTTLDEIETAISDARDIARLQDRCDRLRERAERRLGATTAPETIPTTPRLSLAYNDIEKGNPIGSGGNADVYRASAATDCGEVDLALK